jgi:hypothetical protein
LLTALSTGDAVQAPIVAIEPSVLDCEPRLGFRIGRAKPALETCRGEVGPFACLRWMAGLAAWRARGERRALRRVGEVQRDGRGGCGTEHGKSWRGVLCWDVVLERRAP